MLEQFLSLKYCQLVKNTSMIFVIFIYLTLSASIYHEKPSDWSWSLRQQRWTSFIPTQEVQIEVERPGR
jgi:hypothetical protein